MKLATPFIKLPVRFDVERLRQEVGAFPGGSWAPHPNAIPGNSALRLITAGGQENDEVAGAMAATAHLSASPYLQQVLASFGVVWSRSRLMQLAAGSEVPSHADITYNWFHRVRLHIPIVTTPEVRFHCDGQSVHMAAGEAWLFDNWRTHRVENPSDVDRIHLVADTTGTSQFWVMAEDAQPEGEARLIDFRPGARVVVATERFNRFKVMPPAEIEHLLRDLASEIASATPGAAGEHEVSLFRRMIAGVCQDWRQLWSLHADTDAGLPAYRRLAAFLHEETVRLGANLKMTVNGVAVPKVVLDRVVRFVIDDTVEAMGNGRLAPAPGVAPAQPAPATRTRPAPRFDRPVFIVSAPRAGSTALFETLAQTPQLWTVGGEAHWLVEGLRQLVPGAPGVDSNRLTASHFHPGMEPPMLGALIDRMRDPSGRAVQDQTALRFLEKTPKNALRIPFFDRLFPDARFIYLWRDPAENISSIMEAWRAGRWKTYENLPGWDGPWSLLLPPGWQGLKGRPLAEVAAHQWSETNRIVMDDLSALAPNRRHVVRYADFARDPAAAIRDIAAFADIAFDTALEQRTASPLPASRYTLTPPKAEKWRANAAEIEPLLDGLSPLLRRMEQFS